MEGSVYHFGSVSRRLRLGLAGSPQITGACCDVGWYLHLPDGALPEMTIFLDQMPADDGLIFSTSYPVGASLTVERCIPYCSSVRRGSSLQEVLDSALGDIFFVDTQGRLFLKLVNEKASFFEAAGVKQLQMTQRWGWGIGFRYKVRSSSSGFVPLAVPPALPGIPSAPTSPLAPAPTPSAPSPSTPAPTSSLAPAPTPSQSTLAPAASSCCADFVDWPSIDNGVTCNDCTALVLTAPYGGRCDAYCESFGHVCVEAAEEVSETCQVDYKAASCSVPISGTSDMLCSCQLLSCAVGSPGTEPTSGPALVPTLAPTAAPTAAPAPLPTRDPTPAPTLAPTAAPTSAPVPVTTPSPTPSCAKVKYAQCGGPGFTGDACCPPAMWCMETSQWWAQCEPCAETWDASCAGALSLDQSPRLVQVHSKSAGPEPSADPDRHDVPARIFLAQKKHGI